MSSLLVTPNIVSIVTHKADVLSAVATIKRAFNHSEAAFSGKSYSPSKSLERRTDERIPVEIPLFMKQVIRSGNHILLLDDPPIMGFTHDCSSQGFGFSYDHPLRCKYLLVEFDLYNIGSLELVVELRWSRKKASHAYVGGALVVGIAGS